MEIEKIIKIAESDFWTVTEQTFNNGKGLLFSKYSPAGQDFNIPIVVVERKKIIQKERVCILRS